MKTRLQIQYTNIKSVSNSVSHAEGVSLPSPLTADYVDDASVTTMSSKNFIFFTHKFEQEFGKSHLITQGELNDLVRDLNLNKEKSELLGSRLHK